MAILTAPINKVLVANRGEIACRVMKTCKLLGIRTVAVYSDVDAGSPHVKMADEAVCIGPAVAAESYLNQDKIIHACLLTGANAVHPENADFANLCAQNKIVFIGPRPESILAIGDKISSKVLLAQKAPQVPLLPGYNGADQSVDVLVKEALRIGFPVLLKASAGGGGKGMRIVRTAGQLKEEIEAAQGEAKRSFGDARLLIEKYVEVARHIEVQIFGDSHGDAVAIFERECSVQRRHQKIIEECPSPFLTPELRNSMTSAAVAIANLINYMGAGTVEFIVDGATGKFYFLEVNTRLQVEHPVTEAVTGLDLVALQIWVARGGKLRDFIDENGGIKMKGHAIEVRIYAEDPENEFFPSTGRISKWKLPTGSAVRSDSGIEQGSEITSYYDPLISKLTIHGATRAQAIQRLASVLRETSLMGLPANNVSFLLKAITSAEFGSGVYDTNIVARLQKNLPAENERQSFKSRMALGVSGAIVWGWSLRKSGRQGTAYRRVKSGFRNVPHVSQKAEFRIGHKAGSFEISLAVEYDVVRENKDSADFAIRIFELKAPEAKGARRISELLWEGEVTLLDSVVESAGYDGVENGSVRIICENIQQGLSLSRTSENQLIFVNSKEWDAKFLTLQEVDKYKSAKAGAASQDGVLVTPMPCRIISVNSATGTKVKVGDVVLTIESMKMETKIRASSEGVVEIKVKEGDMVKAGEVVAVIAPRPPHAPPPRKMDEIQVKVDKGALLPTESDETWIAVLRNFYLIPEGQFLAVWDRFMVFAAVVNGVLLSLMTSFRQLTAGAFVVCYILDALYIVDMVIRFHVAYLMGGFWVVIPKDMAANYMGTLEFKLDAIANLQFDLVALAWGVGTDDSLYVLSLIRLVKLIRTTRIWTYFSRQEKKLHASLLVRILKFVSLLLMLIHLFACVWFSLACPLGTPSSCYNPSWVETIKMAELNVTRPYFTANLPTIYGFSVYWAVTTLTTTGYGDIRPESDSERLFAVLAMTCGIFFFGYVSGTIASALSNMDSRRVSYQQKMEAVRQYMSDRNMEADMQERVLDYYDYVWERNRGIDVRNLFEDMPSTFKGEVALSLNNAIIDRANIFRKCSNGFRRLIAIHMKLYLFTANEYVIHKGDLGIEMFFITQGRIDVYATEDMKRPTSSLIEGAHFGEFQIILDYRHEYSARAVCNTDIYVLKKEDLDFAFSCYPEDRELVRHATEERYEQAQSAKKSRKAKMDTEFEDDENVHDGLACAAPVVAGPGKRRGSNALFHIKSHETNLASIPDLPTGSVGTGGLRSSMLSSFFSKEKRASNLDVEKGPTTYPTIPALQKPDVSSSLLSCDKEAASAHLSKIVESTKVSLTERPKEPVSLSRHSSLKAWAPRKSTENSSLLPGASSKPRSNKSHTEAANHVTRQRVEAAEDCAGKLQDSPP
ncbi:hypothetical protein HDU84_004867 [Entophlyctis sp. JEL0112]|nr:hypothetical protein HDU84_004867 [Entophlyctis sp. JEL0112]